MKPATNKICIPSALPVGNLLLASECIELVVLFVPLQLELIGPIPVPQVAPIVLTQSPLPPLSFFHLVGHVSVHTRHI